MTFRIFGYNSEGGAGSWGPGDGTGNDIIVNGSTADVSSSTSVQFVSTSSSAAEDAGTTNLALAITNFDAANATSVTITATGATGRITTFTTPVTFPANSGANENVVVTMDNNLLCDGDEDVTFTITGISGGQGTPTIGTNASHVLTVNDDDVCLNTSVQFVSTSSSAAENSGTTDLALAITDFDATNPTSVTIAATGATGRITTFTTPVIFPANSGINENVVVTLDNNLLCDGNENVTFTITGISGGVGTPFIGANASHVLTVTDDEVAVDPTATAATAVGANGFTANWDAISGVTGYFLDVYTLSAVPATDLFISEYVEGSGSNKYIEIYNGTGASVDLSDYRLRLYSNGAVTPTNDNQLTGTLNDGDVIVYRNSGAVVYGGTSETNSSLNYNGDDAVALFKISTASNVDIFGRIGEDPGSAWTAGSLTTLNKTLRRKSTVTGGVTVNPGSGFPTLASEWDMFDEDDVTGLGAHTYNGASLSYVPGYNNFSAGTATSEVITGLVPLTTYYYVVRATGGCATANTSNEIEVTTTAVATYYSRSTGAVTDAIWSDTPTGAAGPAIWTAASNMVVQNGHVVTNAATVDVNDVTVELGGELVLAAASTFQVNGDEAIFDGALTAADNSTLALVGADATILESTGGPLSLFDLTVNTPNGCLTDATIAVRGTLLLEDGAFDASLGSVTLISNVDGTARLGPVGATASYVGSTFTMQRYIPAGSTNWRFLGSPVSGNTIANWQDDFFTAGYPGSAYPEFFDPPGSGIYWPSIRQYDETIENADPNVGVIGVESQNTALLAGKGFAAWSGDNFSTTTAFSIDMTGAPRVASSPITLPMTWTDSGNPVADGWNLVSNPLPSPIDFTLISRGADVANQYYIFDPATGNNRTWSNGIGSGEVNGIIQSSQGFWLKATGAAVTTTVGEGAKVLASAGGVFGGDQQGTRPMLRLNLTNDQNSFSDESIVVFDEGSPALDAIDATKLVFAHPQAPQLATRSSDGADLAIDFHGTYDQVLTIPVTVKAGVSGTYTLTAAMIGINTLGCLSLEDLETGVITPLTDGAAYTFTLNSTPAPVERFVIRGSAPLGFAAMDATCGGADNGQATVEVTNGPVDITWTDAFGTVLLQQSAVEAGTVTFAGLAPGSYTVRVNSGEACGELVGDFMISAPFVLEAAVQAIASSSCPNTEDGVLDMLVLGGTAPYLHAWSNGASTEDLVAGAGSYTLTVTDANGCTWTSEPLTIAAGEGPVAGIAAEATVLVNTEMTFASTSELADTWAWDFGDGTVSSEAAPVHTYALPGVYTVTLVVTYGDCSDATTFEVTVEQNVGVTAAAPVLDLRAWAMAENIVVAHSLEGAVRIELLDATGRLHRQLTSATGPGTLLVPGNGLSNGIWFLRVTHAGQQRTLRVPLMR
ncbi:MAG: PKD domain-containing protein [Flavobacteriales bacterium]